MRLITRTLKIIVGACIVALAINLAAPITAFWADMQPVARRVVELARQYRQTQRQ